MLALLTTDLHRAAQKRRWYSATRWPEGRGAVRHVHAAGARGSQLDKSITYNHSGTVINSE